MLFGPFWYEGEIGFLFSDTGAGKTTLAVQIAQSIASGTHIDNQILMTAKPQKVLFCDFELSEKQFELRFKNKKTGEKFIPSNNIIRVQLDYTNYDIKTNMQEAVFSTMKEYLTQTGIKTVIIDNISYIQEVSDFNQALKFMQKLKILKQDLKLSILVLAHTPKRNLTDPMTENTMGGSKMLMNFADILFAIGKSTISDRVRYLKQVKVRMDAMEYGADNVFNCEIVQRNGFLKFEFNGNNAEFIHLKRNVEKEERDEKIIEKLKLGKTQKEIAKEHNLSDRQIRNIKTEYEKKMFEDNLPF